MNLIKFYSSCVIALVLTAQSLHSQSSNAPTGEEAAAQQSVSFRTLGIKRMPDSPIFYQSNNNFEELDVAYFRISSSEDATVGEDGMMSFFKRETNPEGGYLYNPLTQVQIPANSGQVLILSTVVGEKVMLKAIEDNLSKNDRDWLYINASQAPLAVQVGEGSKPVSVPPGRSVSHQAEVETGSAAIRVAAFKEEGWESIYARFWPVYAGQRSLVLFIEEAGEIKVYNFFDAVMR